MPVELPHTCIMPMVHMHAGVASVSVTPLQSSSMALQSSVAPGCTSVCTSSQSLCEVTNVAGGVHASVGSIIASPKPSPSASG